MTFEAVPSGLEKSREKTLREDYVQARKAFEAAKKDNPAEVKPKLPKVSVLAKAVNGKDKAEALAAKFRDKYEAKQAAKQGKEGGETDVKPAETKGKTKDEVTDATGVK